MNCLGKKKPEPVWCCLVNLVGLSSVPIFFVCVYHLIFSGEECLLRVKIKKELEIDVHKVDLHVLIERFNSNIEYGLNDDQVSIAQRKQHLTGQ